ncbi:lysophospholipid acyltransferase family protein [Nakamurella panacisegetis]|uniref:lysophospholipid acyltransferase family protein n=1 Tax=Nakamurella panacisegetis TaxID=1090615 RepID=UPI001E3267AA|nr:lysophospholipid acyltransferase family protein [Nakamurella panacisegetis]
MRRRGPVFETANKWIRLCEIVMFPLTRMLGRPSFEGLEHIAVPGPVLVVGNHISELDPVYTAVYLRKSGRIPHIMAKASLWKVPVVGRILTGTEMIPVERGGGQGQVGLQAAIDSLQAGRVVLIYPDGTCSRDPDHWPMKPRPGVAAMALAGDFPVVPVVHWGTQEVLPYLGKGFHPFPRKKIRIVAGPPIDLSAFRGQAVDARLIRDVSYVIQGAVRDLLAQVRGVPAPKDFYDQKKAERLRAAAAAAEAGATSAPETPER